VNDDGTGPDVRDNPETNTATSTDSGSTEVTDDAINEGVHR
jgi:hypothetical protein